MRPDRAPLADRIAGRIFLLRGLRVILDADLARLYGVETRRLNEQVRRNLRRFPVEFAFQVSKQELAHLMSQIATSNRGRGGVRKPPLAFTEHGAVMAATVLNSARGRGVALRGARVRASARRGRPLQGNRAAARRARAQDRRPRRRDPGDSERTSRSHAGAAVAAAAHRLRLAVDLCQRPLDFIGAARAHELRGFLSIP